MTSENAPLLRGRRHLGGGRLPRGATAVASCDPGAAADDHHRHRHLPTITLGRPRRRPDPLPGSTHTMSPATVTIHTEEHTPCAS